MKINTIRLRILVALLGMSLPFIVAILAWVYKCIPNHFIPDSISATYYLAPCITPFMIILGVAAVLLISYQGYDKQDDIICTISGLCALGVCLFPCVNETLEKVGTFQLESKLSGSIHNISAVIFFLLLAYNSFFLFTKTSGNMTKNKKRRNLIYRICGIGMLASFILLIPFNKMDIWGGTWIVETIALAFFGISWLTKADVFPFLFCDSPYKD